MLRLRRILAPGSFARQVALVSGGTVASQAIVLATSPILTRLYSPEDFGVLAVFSSILGILLSIGGLRYETAIPLAKDDSEALAVLALCLLVPVVFGAIVVALLASGLVAIGPLSGSPTLDAHYWLIPMGLVLSCWNLALSNWALRKGAFSAIARSKLDQGLYSSAIQLGSPLFLKSPAGLLIGHLFLRAGGTLRLIRVLRRTAVGLRAPSRKEIWQATVQHKNFALFSTWASLASAVSAQLPPLLLASYFGSTTAGLYALGLRLLRTPMMLLGSSIGQVFFARASGIGKQIELTRLTLQVYVALCRVGVPVIATIGISAPEAFSLLFGSEWRLAGVYTQWLCPWLFALFVASPISSIPSIRGRQQADLAFQLWLLGVRVLALLVGAQLSNVNLAIALYSIASALSWLTILAWILRLAGVTVQVSLTHTLKAVLASVPLIVPAILGRLTTLIMNHELPTLIGAVVSFALIAPLTLRRLTNLRMVEPDGSFNPLV